MPNNRPPSRIFPKVSTLPRQRTEAAHYLDMYKLTIEKKRIQQELDNISQKQRLLQDRLTEIDDQLGTLNDGAETMRQQDEQHYSAKPKSMPPRATQPMPTSNIYLPERSTHATPEDYNTVVLDY